MSFNFDGTGGLCGACAGHVRPDAAKIFVERRDGAVWAHPSPFHEQCIAPKLKPDMASAFEYVSAANMARLKETQRAVLTASPSESKGDNAALSPEGVNARET
jgi:hypothetical protein